MRKDCKRFIEVCLGPGLVLEKSPAKFQETERLMGESRSINGFKEEPPDMPRNSGVRPLKVCTTILFIGP